MKDDFLRLCFGLVEYLAGANAAIMPYILATAGAAGLIANFGSEKVNNLFREKMYSGDWEAPCA